MRQRVAGRDRVFPRKSRHRAGFHPVRGLLLPLSRERVAVSQPKSMAMRIHNRPAVALTALLAALWGCGDPAGPDRGVPPGELTVLRQAANAPALAATEISFWVKAGDGIEREIPYANGHDYLEFKVPGNALLRYPDGRRFERGDSVRITIRVLDPALFQFEFLPAGLVFDRDHPAELEISFRYADRDFNADGVIDERDRIDRVSIWRQEAGQSTWDELLTAIDVDLEEAEADVLGFSKFMMASE